MGWLRSLFGSRFVSDAAFRDNLRTQTAMSPETVAQLRHHGVAPGAALKLEFFFYTDRAAKADACAAALAALGYAAKTKPAADGAGLIVVSGWTTPIRIEESDVVSWTKQMCELGYAHDCDFDGWGTSPSQ